MTNTNNLEGVKCPACGNEDTFRIEITTMAEVTDDGAEAGDGGMNWDETSYAECANCLEHGKLSHFKAQSEAPAEPSEPAPECVTNRTRAAWANAALHVFGQLTGCDREDSLGDLLCDLMHWAGQNGFDFGAALDRARDHYEEEQIEDFDPASMYEALLNIKLLAQKHDDNGYKPYTLELIEQKAIAALAPAKGGSGCLKQAGGLERI